MSAAVDRAFLARDAYPAWKKRVQAARESIVVFVPYLDDLLDRLLKNSILEVDAITVISDLSPTSGALDYRRQLLGVRALLRRDIEVRSLPRLHAKVLLCDWRTTTIGSQNFTSYARNSHEATVVPTDNLSESTFVTTLKEWFDAALPVDLIFVEQLLADLENEMKAVQAAQATLAASYDQLWDDYQQRLEQKRKRRAPIGPRITAAVRSARKIQPRPTIRAQLSVAGDGEDWYRFNTLRAASRSHFTRLLIPDGQGFADPDLDSLQMYPVILNPSGRMGFGRVGKTRISYVRSAVDKIQQTIAGTTYCLFVECPEQDFDIANLHITLRPESGQSTAAVKLLMQFDLAEAALVGHEVVGDDVFSADVPGSSHRALRPEDVAASFAAPEARRQLMQSALAAFKYDKPEFYVAEAGKFFPAGWLDVTLVEYADQPVFVVSQ